MQNISDQVNCKVQGFTTPVSENAVAPVIVSIHPYVGRIAVHIESRVVRKLQSSVVSRY